MSCRAADVYPPATAHIFYTKAFILYFFYGYPYLAVIVLGIIRYRVEIRFDIQISRHTVLLGIGQPLVKYIVIYLL